MKCSILIVAFLLAILSDGNAAKPSILVKMHFSISWREMCQLEKYLIENVAKQIVTGKHGETLSASRIVLYNFQDNCKVDSSSKHVHAVVEMFVVNEKGSKDMNNIDVPLTKKLYEVLHYLYEQNQERYLGNLFVGKITDITVTGDQAPEKKTSYTEIERLYIGIGVACAVLILIVIILVAISCYKNRNKPKEDRYSARAAYKKDNEAVRTYPVPADNPAYEQDRGAEKGQVSHF